MGCGAARKASEERTEGTANLTTGDNVPELVDFTAHERMAGEYAVMGIYPKGTRDGVREADPGSRRPARRRHRCIA